MLAEIRCDQFKQKVVTFQEGLNVVLGDEYATNSIGKSTFLMVIDFVFGGEDFRTLNADVVNELGNHAYFFCHLFAGERFYFRRETLDPRVIYKCNREYEEIGAISIEEYYDFLNKNYSASDLDMSFRSMVGPYSRVWPKENIDVMKPLNVFKKQKDSDAIDNLLKLFDRYKDLQKKVVELKRQTDIKKSLSDAIKHDHIPKITKAAYRKNEIRIDSIKSEIESIKKDLALHACNLKDLVNKDILELKDEKDQLLETRLDLESRLRRVNNNLSGGGFLRSKSVEALVEFFPSANVEKIAEIEGFHEKLSRILKKELAKSEGEILEDLQGVNSEIEEIDRKILRAINHSIDNPSIIIDRVVSLYAEQKDIAQKNQFYQTGVDLKTDIAAKVEVLGVERQRSIDVVVGMINNTVREVTTIIYSKDRKSPQLEVNGKTYTYVTWEDTGTGKAYSNLILFDLVVLKLTKLPFLIHDSLLFKNIENSAVQNIFEYYGKNKKQIFISIDEIRKYGVGAEALIKGRAVLQLSDDSQLYIKDWRSKKSRS